MAPTKRLKKFAENPRNVVNTSKTLNYLMNLAYIKDKIRLKTGIELLGYLAQAQPKSNEELKQAVGNLIRVLLLTKINIAPNLVNFLIVLSNLKNGSYDAVFKYLINELPKLMLWESLLNNILSLCSQMILSEKVDVFIERILAARADLRSKL